MSAKVNRLNQRTSPYLVLHYETKNKRPFTRGWENTQDKNTAQLPSSKDAFSSPVKLHLVLHHPKNLHS